MNFRKKIDRKLFFVTITKELINYKIPRPDIILKVSSFKIFNINTNNMIKILAQYPSKIKVFHYLKIESHL